MGGVGHEDEEVEEDAVEELVDWVARVRHQEDRHHAELPVAQQQPASAHHPQGQDEEEGEGGPGEDGADDAAAVADAPLAPAALRIGVHSSSPPPPSPCRLLIHARAASRSCLAASSNHAPFIPIPCGVSPSKKAQKAGDNGPLL